MINLLEFKRTKINMTSKDSLKKHIKDKTKKTSDSDSDNSDSEHELSFYVNDRIKLMQEVLKLIKSKKIMTMAPDSMKDMQLSAVKSLLLEELLGISNKRLRCILAGETLDGDSSSSSESCLDMKEDIEIISLDEITDDSEIYVSDDNCMEIQLSERERLELEIDKPTVDKRNKNKLLDKNKNGKVIIKIEGDKKKKKHKKKLQNIKKEQTEIIPEEPVMNVLNLLELQARARAIRSQLANETLCDKDTTKTVEAITNVVKEIKKPHESDSEGSVIFVSPQDTSVVMVHSNSESETEVKDEKVQNNAENPDKDIAKTSADTSKKNSNKDTLKKIVETSDNDNKKIKLGSHNENSIKRKAENSIKDSTKMLESTNGDSAKINIESNLENIKNNSEPINKDLEKPSIVISIDEDYNNDVLIVTEDIPFEQDAEGTEQKKSDDADQENSDTWKSRWLESRKVKDVMRTTKLYNNLRHSRKQKTALTQEVNTQLKNVVNNLSNIRTEVLENSPDIQDNSLNEMVDKNLESL